jgi:hypothetical protein
MFGIGGPPQRTKEGAIISQFPTWIVTLMFLATLAGVGQLLFTAGDVVWMSQRGVLVSARVVSNRAEVTKKKTFYHALIAYTPDPTGAAPPTEVRVELPDEGAYLEGSEIYIFYDPDDLKHVRRYYFTEDWLSLAILFGLVGVAGALLGHNLHRRRRREIVTIPTPPETDSVDYTPTAAEDAEYDRNKAAGTPKVRALVDGKWITLKGKALEDSLRDDRRSDWKFLAAGLGLMLLAIAFLFNGLWFFSPFLFPLGAAFSFVSYLGLRDSH